MSFKSIVNGRLTDHKSSPCHYVIGELKRRIRRNGAKTIILPTLIGRLNYYKFLDQWFWRRCCLKKKLRATEVLNLFYGSPMVYFKENYNFLRFQRGSYVLKGGGSNFFQGGWGVKLFIL